MTTSSLTGAVHTVRKNGGSVAAVARTASESEMAALYIIFDYKTLADGGASAWRQLDSAQRDVVRKYARRRAADAERAAEAAKGDSPRKAGRPPLGERALTSAERKRRSRAAAADGAPTAERLRNEMFKAFTDEIYSHCMGWRETQPTCNEIIDIVSEKYPVELRGKIAHYFGWPLSDASEQDFIFEQQRLDEEMGNREADA
jgi:hypothetical protein